MASTIRSAGSPIIPSADTAWRATATEGSAMVAISPSTAGAAAAPISPSAYAALARTCSAVAVSASMSRDAAGAPTRARPWAALLTFIVGLSA